MAWGIGRFHARSARLDSRRLLKEPSRVGNVHPMWSGARQGGCQPADHESQGNGANEVDCVVVPAHDGGSNQASSEGEKNPEDAAIEAVSIAQHEQSQSGVTRRKTVAVEGR